MSRIKTIETKDIAKTVNNGGCGECQTSCQSACKTSCGVANQQGILYISKEYIQLLSYYKHSNKFEVEY